MNSVEEVLEEINDLFTYDPNYKKVLLWTVWQRYLQRKEVILDKEKHLQQKLYIHFDKDT